MLWTKINKKDRKTYPPGGKLLLGYWKDKTYALGDSSKGYYAKDEFEELYELLYWTEVKGAKLKMLKKLKDRLNIPNIKVFYS
jgi:hypothetical protein